MDSVKREIRKSVWQGSVPVCLRLASKDAAGIEAPLPLYLMLPRLSYFPLIYDRVKSHFLGVVPTALDEIWLESSSGEPLRWHLAVGVLFDMLNEGLTPPIPWQLTVHFSSFPEDRLLRLSGLEAVKSQFMNSLKEANFLKWGDGSKVMSLSRVDQDNLWLSIGAGESGMQQFWDVGDQLLGDFSQLKSVAFRFFKSSTSGAFVQLPLRPFNDDGSQKTVGQALEALGFATKLPRVHGVMVPLEATLVDVQATLQHCDNWVYVSLS